MSEEFIHAAGEIIEDICVRLYRLCCKKHLEKIISAIKTLFLKEAPVKNDANFMCAVEHVQKQAEKWSVSYEVFLKAELRQYM